MKARFPVTWQRLLLAVLLLLFAACDSGGDALTEPLTEIGAFDEWTTDAPASQNLDVEILTRMTESLREGDYGQVHSLLIARNGVLVYEEYFRGATREGLHRALILLRA